jgi:curved DNA-binding protein
MPDPDYYKVLGVSREASADEIRKAHRKLSRKYHPDMRPNDQEAVEKFKQIQTAFDVIGDPEKREQYDRYGAAFGQRAAGPRGRAQAGGAPFGGGPVDFKDLFGGQFEFGDLFGGGAGRAERTQRARQGNDVKLDIEVPFQIAVEGGNHELQLQRNGKPERLTVKIPAGVETGSVIRLAGQGEPGRNGGPTGDLLITIHAMPHPFFRREGNNLLLELPLTITEAGLGAKIDVPTLAEGTVTLTIPPGTSSGTKLRLRGKGALDRQTKNRGDQFVVIKIVVPPKLSSAAQDLLKQFGEIVPQSPRQGLW